jgi:hypothetical protein
LIAAMNIPLQIFFILDAIILIFFFWKTIKGYFFLKELISWESSKGKLIFLEKKKLMNKVYVYPVVEFKTNNYRTISFRSEKINGKKFKEDDPLEVLYDPYAPHKAVIKGFENDQFNEGMYGTITFTILNVSIAIVSLLVKFAF